MEKVRLNSEEQQRTIPAIIPDENKLSVVYLIKIWLALTCSNIAIPTHSYFHHFTSLLITKTSLPSNVEVCSLL